MSTINCTSSEIPRYTWNWEGVLCTFGVIGQCMLFVSFSRGRDTILTYNKISSQYQMKKDTEDLRLAKLGSHM